ncbi:transcriptional regulator [Rubrobacter taiwanensis]|jgi:glucitol operon activator protein|uniref:Transcriptional regulator n=1 Tax=Rubrobacter taiwanensis TaxID=185139 RepID=A0A4R1BN15_9ACTN|nr:transcriptional regulator GutM [Rubrobacter taiwanensis]TCJ18893.1 transcriptional regulator [Rubrobacter taiwanensis]
MGVVAWLLLILAVLWALQAVGTYFQMRHYREVLSSVMREGGEGYVGVGNAKARFGKGVILMLVTDEGGSVIRRALKMRGATVFARFREAPELVGVGLDELRSGEREEPRSERGTLLAARRAIEQIDRIRAEREGREVIMS